MTRLKPPTRKVPKGASTNNKSTTSTRSMVQIILMITIVACVVLTVFVNIKSTSAAVLEGLHYGAAVTTAIAEFKKERTGSNSPRVVGAAKMDNSPTITGNRKSPVVPGQQEQRQEQEQQHDDEEEETEEEPKKSDTAAVPPRETIPSKIASLSCEKHGGPPDEFAQEMVYWSDVPSDSLYVSPLRQKRGERRQYMTFEPDGGGWNNIRMAMETVVGMAVAMGRTLVLPPHKTMYLLGNGKNNQQKQFGFEDFFPMHQMAHENAALDIITMQEFLETEAMTGQLKNRDTGEASFPPRNQTDWNGLTGKEYDELREWLRTVTLVPQWQPDRCLAAFPANGNHQSISELQEMQAQIHKEGINFEDYIGKPVAVDGPPIDRMKENLNKRRDLCVYDEAMQQELVVHFACAHKLNLRLLVHFYAFIFMEDWREDLWMKRFMRDHMRYEDHIQCAAGRIVHKMRSIARNNDPQGNPEGLFDTMHVRRGDFQYKDTRIDANKLYENTKKFLTPNATIYIATDERDKAFFDPLRQHYNLYFMDDFIATDLEGVNTNLYGMTDQLVASRGRVFFGCWFSTFTGFINRMRGYRSVKDKLPGHEDGVLPTSYYYVPTDRQLVLHRYQPLSNSFFAREFPTSWRDIDKGIGMLPEAIV